MDILKALSKFHSWKLDRISPTTFPNDILFKGSAGLSSTEIDAVAGFLKQGSCYRCRIAKGRFYYGTTTLTTAACRGCRAGSASSLLAPN